MRIKVLVYGLSFIVLTGCSTLNEHFDCPAPKGGSCKRMDEVYESINKEQQLAKPFPMQVWVAPYKDEQGQYHPAHMRSTQ